MLESDVAEKPRTLLQQVFVPRPRTQPQAKPAVRTEAPWAPLNKPLEGRAKQAVGVAEKALRAGPLGAIKAPLPTSEGSVADIISSLFFPKTPLDVGLSVIPISWPKKAATVPLAKLKRFAGREGIEAGDMTEALGKTLGDRLKPVGTSGKLYEDVASGERIIEDDLRRMFDEDVLQRADVLPYTPKPKDAPGRAPEYKMEQGSTPRTMTRRERDALPGGVELALTRFEEGLPPTEVAESLRRAFPNISDRSIQESMQTADSLRRTFLPTGPPRPSVPHPSEAAASRMTERMRGGQDQFEALSQAFREVDDEIAAARNTRISGMTDEQIRTRVAEIEALDDPPTEWIDDHFAMMEELQRRQPPEDPIERILRGDPMPPLSAERRATQTALSRQTTQQLEHQLATMDELSDEAYEIILELENRRGPRGTTPAHVDDLLTEQALDQIFMPPRGRR